MVLNNGKYKGRQVLRPGAAGNDDPPVDLGSGQEEREHLRSSIEPTAWPCIPSSSGTSRVVKDHELNLWGHTGEAYGLLSGLFVVPGTKNGSST